MSSSVGPELWPDMPIEVAHDLLSWSANELRTAHAKKAYNESHDIKDGRLKRWIDVLEAAHECHWLWWEHARKSIGTG